MLKFNTARWAYISGTGFQPLELATEAKIASFSTLPTGWHYGRGGPIQTHTVSLSQRIVRIFSDFNIGKTDAFPGVDGEVMVTAYSDDDYYEIVISSADKISILRETSRIENFSQGDLDEKTAAWHLGELLGEKCITSGYFIQNTSMLKETNLKVWHLRTMTEALPSYSENVWIQHPLPSATTFESFIQPQGAIPPSSGFFLKWQSQRATR